MTANPTGNARTWTYSYRNTYGSKPFWEGGTAINIQSLGSVTQPDGRAWTFNLDDLFQEPTPGECDSYPSPITVTHPYGVTGTFQLAEVRHRMGLNEVMQQIFDCPNGESSPPGPANPAWVTAQIDTISVVSKQLQGPGIATATWAFQYEFDGGPPGSSAADPTNTTTVVQPDNSVIQYHHRWQFSGLLGGKLLRKDIRQSSGSAPQETTSYTYAIEDWPGYSFAAMGPLAGFVKIRPSQITIVRDGSNAYSTDFVYDSSFSSPTYSFGHPTQVTETSTTAPGLSRLTSTAYLHDKALWIVALPTSETRNGKLFDSYTYDSLRRVQTHSRFGTLKGSYTYHTSAGQQGMVSTYADALNNSYTLSNWKRGKPQTVGRPDGTSISRVVDNNGWVTSETDGRGITTGFDYNLMGWMTSVYRPSGFHGTTTSYSGYGSALQAVSIRGAQRTTVFYDAMLRPTLVKRDATDASVTPIYDRSTFDAFGRETFKSWPSTSASPTAGVNTTFDALGRVVTSTETVAPYANTTTQYLAGGQTRVTDPTGALTIATHRAFGTPAKPEVMQVIDALGAVTATSRDIFGNVTQLTQSGTQNGYSAGVTRQFWYDTGLRLCRHRAPEFGDELFTYDAMDRLQFSSRGEAPATGCTTPSSSIRTAYTYDARGRLAFTDFPSTTPDIAVTYDANGNKASVSRGGVNWGYLYNALDQLARETLSIDGRSYQFDYGYTAGGHLASRTRAGGTAVSFAPDVLGRASALTAGGSSYVHGVAWHPNGLVGAGNFGNGQVFSQSLDARQRPLALSTARSGGPTALSRSHAYDVRGQLTSITDHVDAAGSRGFGYDAKGRLVAANGPWGSGSFTYDALDNLRAQTLGSRAISVAYDATNRVASANDAGIHRPYAYDAHGNATTVGPLTFAYDFSNQPVAIGGATSASYVYDGNGKRVKSVAGGKTVYSVYSALGGSVILRDEVSDGKVIDYLAVGPLAVRLTNGASPEYTHADHLGSPVAASNASGAISWRETYTPYGQPLLRPAGNANQPGYTGHVQDAATGLTYMQARYHDPVIGRFLATDPVGYEDQLNLYAYVRNDPVNATDPDGRETEMKTWADPKGMTHSEATSGQRMAASFMLGMVPGVNSAEYAAKGQLAMAAAMLVVDLGPAKILKTVDKVTDATKATLPHVPTGPGTVPKAERDPQRLFTPAQREAKRAEQGGQCANGCGTKIDDANSAGHHKQRHADGGKTNSDNHAEVCLDCHAKIHGRKPD